MTIDFNKGDDLSDLLGGEAPVAQRVLPQAPELARVRAHIEATPMLPCPRCNGTGMTRWGQCFKCHGSARVRGFKTAAPVRAANREKLAARKARAGEANWTAFVEQFPAEAAVLTKGIAQTYGDGRWNGICADIKGKVERYGDLHEGTMAMLGRAVARDAERAAQRSQTAVQQQERVAGIDVANIVDAFLRAAEAGLKRFTLRFDGVHFQVDKRDPALIWVSAGGYGTAKYGRISGGQFRPGRDATDAVLAAIALISADPMAAAMAYAQVTSSCSVCGRHLENQDSVDAGIGPVCAGRINRPGLKMVPVEPGSF